MTKIKLILFFLVFCFTNTFSDVIITLDNKKIECKVLEVNIDYIKYKRSDNIEGPIYTILKKELKSITYDNGVIDTFQKEKKAKITYIADPITYNGETVVFSQKKGFSFANGDSISENQYIYLTQQYCLEANKQYIKGDKLRRSGKWLIAIGLPTTIIGVGLNITYKDNEKDLAKKNIGTILWAIGAPTLGAGIPLYVVGIKQKKKSVETFNKNNAQTTLSFNVSPNNSIGFTLTF